MKIIDAFIKNPKKAEMNTCFSSLRRRGKRTAAILNINSGNRRIIWYRLVQRKCIFNNYTTFIKTCKQQGL